MSRLERFIVALVAAVAAVGFGVYCSHLQAQGLQLAAIGCAAVALVAAFAAGSSVHRALS